MDSLILKLVLTPALIGAASLAGQRWGPAVGGWLVGQPLTGIASTPGPHLTGLLAPFPLYAAILAIFAHHQQGPVPAARVLRGLIPGLFAFAGFFLVLVLLIERASIALAFVSASMVALAIQAGSLWVLRRASKQVGASRENA